MENSFKVSKVCGNGFLLKEFFKSKFDSNIAIVIYSFKIIGNNITEVSFFDGI
jgi:hypothetical protein